MNRKVAAGVALAVVGAIIGGYLVVKKGSSRPPVTVTLRIAVAPKEQTDFVAGKANSPMFKYVLGKQAGVKPVLAQKLEVKPVPDSTLLEARVGVLTRDEGQRYADAFIGALQDLCGKQVQLTLAEKSVK